MIFKKTILCCALAGLVLTSCGKKPQAEVAVVPEPTVPATPEPHLVAPAGVYFLVKKASVETDSGILNYAAGTKVHKIGGRYVASDGRQITLRADQVTNNLQLAQQAAGHDAKALAIIQATAQTARAIQSSTPPAAASTTSPINASTPKENVSYAKPAAGKSGDAESRRSDSSRLKRN